MKRLSIPAVVVMAMFFAYLPTARAQSATIGCTTDTCSGGVTFSGDVGVGSFAVSTSTAIGLQINSVSGLNSFESQFDDLVPNAEAFQMTLSNVSLLGGTFTFTDTDGDLSLSGHADLASNPTSNNPGSVDLQLFINSITIGGGDDNNLLPSTTLSVNLEGSITLNFTGDPNVSSASGTLGLPTINNPNGNGGSPTPEPSTLLLLGSGLVGLASLYWRRFGAA